MPKRDKELEEIEGELGFESEGSSADDVKGAATAFDYETEEVPPTWEPVKGEILEGRIVKISAVTLEKRQARFMNVENKAGVRTVWYKRVIANFCDEEKVAVGDLIGIRYNGRVKSKGGTFYDDYTIRHRPQSL